MDEYMILLFSYEQRLNVFCILSRQPVPYLEAEYILHPVYCTVGSRPRYLFTRSKSCIRGRELQ